jgi:hypothetical protein
MVRFSIGNRSEELLKKLAKAGVKTVGQMFSMGRNGSFIPWFMRRNEVAAVVDAESL